MLIKLIKLKYSLFSFYTEKMLQPRMTSLLRRNSSVFISALYNNLHTSQIFAGKNKLKRDKSCQSIPVAVVGTTILYNSDSLF